MQRQAKYRSAVQSENKFDAESGAQARAAGNFGERPPIVLTAGNPHEDPDPALTKAETDQRYNLWVNDLQVQLARLSTRGKQIVVSGSSHMIPYVVGRSAVEYKRPWISSNASSDSAPTEGLAHLNCFSWQPPLP